MFLRVRSAEIARCYADSEKTGKWAIFKGELYNFLVIVRIEGGKNLPLSPPAPPPFSDPFGPHLWKICRKLVAIFWLATQKKKGGNAGQDAISGLLAKSYLEADFVAFVNGVIILLVAIYWLPT